MHGIHSRLTPSRYSFLRGRGRRATRQLAAVLFAFIAILSIISSMTPDKAVAAANGTLTFQSRLLNIDGSLVADGDYNAEFKLYDVSSGGSELWSETRTTSNRVTVKNGYLYANLGSVTAFPSTINWDQELWLTMNVGNTVNSGACGAPFTIPYGSNPCAPDGEMSPRFKVTSVPFAFAANKLQATNGANSLQVILPTPANGINTVTVPDETGTICLQNASSCGFTTGSGAAFVQGGNSFGVAANIGTGDAFDLNIITDGTTRLSVSSTGDIIAGSNLLTVSTTAANVQIGSVTTDASAVLFGIDSYNQTIDPVGYNGAMYYNTNLNKFRCYENGTWVNCIGGSGSGDATASFVSGLQNVAANASGTPAETLIFTSATAVSNTAGVTGFTAPSAGSFETCLIKNNANITAGTLGLRWRVNGVSVGSPACGMDSTTNRQSAGVLNTGTVNFAAGDTIGIAFDTSAGFLPTGTNDFTVYWSVKYTGTSLGGGGSGTLQDAYDQSVAGSVTTTNSKDVKFNLANTATDSNFLIDIDSGATGRFAVQNGGTDVFNIDKGGNVMTAAGITLGASTNTTAGTIRWTGTDFEGYDGLVWKSLTLGSGGGGASGVSVHKIKPADQIVNNSNTFVNDGDLYFPIGANEDYSFRIVIHGNSGTVPDFKFAVTAPAGATCAYGDQDVEGAVSVANLGCGVSTGTVVGNGTADVYEIIGSVRNGSTAGNVQLQWAQNTANLSNTTVFAGSTIDAYQTTGVGGLGEPFVQGGNSFGAAAELGTNDANDLSLKTNGTVHLTLSSSGALQIAGTTTLGSHLLASGVASGTTGTTTGSGTTTTTLTLTTDAFNVDDVIFIDNVGQDYYTRVTADPGTGSYTVSPAVTFATGRTVTKYTIQNIGATTTDYSTQANRFFQGYFLGGIVVGAGSTTISDGNIESTTDLTLQGNGGVLNIGGAVNISGAITGDGSGLTNINGANITGGSVADGALSSNVALLSGTQSFTGLKTFTAGLTVTAGQTLSINGDALTDLTGTGLVNTGGALSVSYGATAGTTVQGNTSLTCASGSGNLSGGGTSITLGSGGTCGAITISNAPTFTTSVTSPTFTGSGAVTLSSGGSSNLTLDSASGIVVLSDPTLQSSASLSFELNAAATTTFTITNTNGANVANLSVEGAITATSYSGNGSALTNLSGGNLTAGSVGDAALSSNVAFLSGSQSFSGLKTFTAGATITAGQTLTINGDGLNDLTGTGLVISGSALQLDTTYLGNNYAKLGGNTLGGLVTLGATDANGISFVTGGTDKLRILSGGNVGINNSNPGNKLNINTPGVASANTEVVITTSALGNKGLVIQGVASQSGALAEFQDNGGNALASVSGTGQLNLGRASNSTGTIVLSNSTNGFTTSLLSGVATVSNKSITLPDENGTICLSNSNNCGYIRLAAGSIQTDATNNDTIAINKTSGTGNLILFQRSGTSAFTVANTGALEIRATSTTGLDIKNGTGTSFFTVDTSGAIVRIGQSTADGTGVLLVLDNKNTVGDPASGEPGAMYYNSESGSFRCYENVRAWTDCIGTPKPNTRRVTNFTATGTTTTFTGSGDAVTTVQNALTAAAATTTEPASIQYATAATNGNVASVVGNLNYNSSNDLSYQTYIKLDTVVTRRVWAGLTNQTAAVMGASANPAGNYAAFRFDTSTAETTWKCVTKNNVTQNVQNSGVTVTTNGVKLEIIVGATSVEFKIDGVTVCSNVANLPAANTMLRFANTMTTLSFATRNMRVGWLYVESDK